MTDDEIIDMLEAADRGELTIAYGWHPAIKAWSEESRATLVGKDPPTWASVYAGDVCFVLSNGWRVVVFNDCEEWDYVSDVIAPDGTSEVIWERPVTGGSHVRYMISDWAPKDIKRWAPDARCDATYEREFWEATYQNAKVVKP